MDGILIINKPKNHTSHDIVNIARKVLKTRRIGHIGTLDPNATGVLVLCVNKATKLVKYFENHDKTYLATIRLGVKTDTDDITGNIIDVDQNISLTKEKILAGLNTFIGKQKQVPPKYSAIKINGRKLYELARRDLNIPEIEPRDIEVFSMEEFEMIDSVTFNVVMKVSKGTYIRSIARDLGESLGTYGTLVDLERLEIDQFNIKDAITIDQLKIGEYQLLDPFKFLKLPHFKIDPIRQQLIENGRFLEPEIFPEKTDTIIFDESNHPLAIYYYDAEKNQMRMSVKWC